MIYTDTPPEGSLDGALSLTQPARLSQVFILELILKIMDEGIYSYTIPDPGRPLYLPRRMLRALTRAHCRPARIGGRVGH
jgi:hypothetical protein